MADEFDTVAQWTAEVALDLGPGYHVPAACRGVVSPPPWTGCSGGSGRPGDLLIDAGAGVGGPAAYACQHAGVRPLLVEPEPDACRASRQLFGFPVFRGDATRLPFADGVVPVAWCLGVLCTTSGPAAQLAVLRELRRVVRPGGRIGLLVFLATVPGWTTRPKATTSPPGPASAPARPGRAHGAWTGAPAHDRPPRQRSGTSAPTPVESELERRHGASPAWRTAEAQSARIGHLLKQGQLQSQVLLLER